MVLQHAQQLGLQLRRQLPDLVQENRSLVSYFELALFSFDGAGERALLVSEELAFEQRLGQRGAVDGDERFVSAVRVRMDGAGNQFLPRAALACNQHGRIGRRHFRDELIDLAHLFGLADHAVLNTDFLLQAAVLGPKPVDVPRAFERHRRQTADGREQLQMVLLEFHLGSASVQVDNPSDLFEGHDRDGQNRLHGRSLAVIEGIAAVGKIVAQNRFAFAKDAIDDGMADIDHALTVGTPFSSEDRNKFVGIVFHQENRGSLRRHDFQHGVEQLLLERFQAVFGTNRGRDFEKRLQVLLQAPGGRQRLDQFLRLQVEQILRSHARGSAPAVFFGTVKFDDTRTGAGGAGLSPVGPVHAPQAFRRFHSAMSEKEQRVADGNEVARLEFALLHRQAVDERSVETIQIEDHVVAGAPCQFAVASGN